MSSLRFATPTLSKTRDRCVLTVSTRSRWPSLAKVVTPTEVIYGTTTYPFVARSVARWCASNAHVRSQVVPGGHCFMQERPANSAGRVADFLLQRS